METGLLYTLASKEFYERPDTLSADSSWTAAVHSKLPKSWTISRNGIWQSCGPVGQALPLQGFKIHLSTIE